MISNMRLPANTSCPSIHSSAIADNKNKYGPALLDFGIYAIQL